MQIPNGKVEGSTGNKSKNSKKENTRTNGTKIVTSLRTLQTSPTFIIFCIIRIFSLAPHAKFGFFKQSAYARNPFCSAKNLAICRRYRGKPGMYW
jgi:hypothetical protein